MIVDDGAAVASSAEEVLPSLDVDILTAIFPRGIIGISLIEVSSVTGAEEQLLPGWAR